MAEHESQIPEAALEHLRDALKEATAARMLLAPLPSTHANGTYAAIHHACICLMRALDDLET